MVPHMHLDSCGQNAYDLQICTGWQGCALPSSAVLSHGHMCYGHTVCICIWKHYLGLTVLVSPKLNKKRKKNAKIANGKQIVYNADLQFLCKCNHIFFNIFHVIEIFALQNKSLC